MADANYTAEIWKSIPDWEGLYEVSSFGRVRRLAGKVTLRHRNGKMMIRPVRARVLSPGLQARTGYLIVVLVDKPRKHTRSIHRLVCEVFHGPCPSGKQVAHLNGKRTDNAATNLRWVTPKENIGHQVAHGTRLRGERRWNAVLKDAEVKEIAGLIVGGARNCDLARRYRVSTSVIKMIRAGRSWQTITGFSR